MKAGIGKYDNHNYLYTQWKFLLEAGFFLTRNEALDYADTAEKELNAARYERYLSTTTHKLTEHAEKVRVREEQNRVLSEAGLPVLPKVPELYLFPSDRLLREPLPYNEWVLRENQTDVWRAEVVALAPHAAPGWDDMIAKARGEK